jgi:protein CpxP
MSIQKPRLITLLVMLSVCLSVGSALAQHPGGPGGGFPGRGPGGPGGFTERFARLLGLTDAQKAQIQTIREESRTASTTYFEQLRPLHEQLRALVEAGTFDAAAARNLVSQISQLQLELQVINARAESAIYNLLTAEQKAKLAELRNAVTEDHPEGGFRGPGGFPDHLASLLNLADAQKAQIQALRDQAETASATYLEQLKPLREQIRTLIEAAAFDETAVRNLATQISQLQLELQFINLSTESAIYNTLTTEQKAKLAELRSSRQRGGPPQGAGSRTPNPSRRVGSRP